MVRVRVLGLITVTTVVKLNIMLLMQCTRSEQVGQIASSKDPRPIYCKSTPQTTSTRKFHRNSYDSLASVECV